MSLRSIHVVVILAAAGTLLFFGFYFMNSYRVLATISLVLGALLIPYLYWFLKKMKNIL